MIKNIPKSRLMFYVILLGLLPPLFAFLNFYSQNTTLSNIEQQMQQEEMNILNKNRKQSYNLAVRDHFKNADHFYIDKELETLEFLKPEISYLKEMLKKDDYIGNDNIVKRLQKISGKDNKLLFTGGQVQSFPTFQESINSLVSPVEVNVDNIKKILSRTEGVEISDYKPLKDRPQLIITDFKLERKQAPITNDEVYLLNMKLLKREFL